MEEKEMKRVLILTGLIVLLIGFGFSQKIRIGATPVPHAEMLEEIKGYLKENDIELDIVVFNDYVLPNLALANGELDANFFQHLPYLNVFTSERGIKGLTALKPIHVEPMGFYSKKSLDTLKKGDIVVLPNDPTNEGRSLLLLQTNGLITLKDSSDLKATVRDIEKNPKELKFKEVEAGFIPRVYKTDNSVQAAVINTNYAISAGLNPIKDAIFFEGEQSPYANMVVINEKDKDEEWVSILQSALRSLTMKKFIEEKYNGAVVSTF
jgi:D-methionine transport system substrate-binding protein